MNDDLKLIIATLGAVSTLMLPLYVWSIKAQLKISQALFGANGDNGINGDVKTLKDAKDHTAGVLRDHQAQLEQASREIERQDEEILYNRKRYHDEFVPAVNGQTNSNMKLAEALHALARATERRP